MEDSNIENDKYLNFDIKVPIQEIENNINIYFHKTTDQVDKKYIRSNNELAINVKWYYPKFHSSLYEKNMESTIEEIGETLIDVFWYKANIISLHYGYAACYRSGRSGGWASPMLKGREFNDIKTLVYESDNEELEYLIKLNIFDMFAKDIENLFRLIDREVRNVKSIEELTILQNKIYDL